ncbi:hypothetical protein CASFOL_040239 [Castilleja foliolosa]|uniref:Uncharacterized protein n=1 Tax=Castilleja foliolosa TaxID=1961234 RepID=A0ABD3BEX8_9LAMI
MTTFWSTEPEFHEIYEEFSSGRARVRTMNELRDLIEDSDIFRYSVEVIVADDTGSSTFLLRNKACEKLIGEPAADVIAQYGDTARTMPQSIKENFLGQKVDKEIKELYIKKNLPDYESSSDEDSFLKTLDYVEEQDRAAEENVHTAEESDEAAEESVEAAGSADEIEPDAKRQKKDMNEDK